jgi:glycosyltransferase involved in cell wall biosynthesis
VVATDAATRVRAAADELVSWPSAAVIVCTRDRPALLERAVRSILSQSYPGDVECVVVFDQDSPTAIPVTSTVGRRLTVITNTRAPGLAGARNSGILASRSDVVAFCDDDDEWAVEKLALQVRLLRSTSAELVACGIRIHHSGSTIVRVPPPVVDLRLLVKERVTALHPSSFVMSRSAVRELGMLDEQIPGSYGEDYDWLLRAARRMPILSVEQPLVEVYWNRQSFFAERWEVIADALVYLLDKHPEIRADRLGRARIQGQIAFAHAAMASRSRACTDSLRALRNNPAERRAYLALAVASGVIPAGAILRLLNQRGRGI